MASPLNSEFAINVVINKIAQIEKLRTDVQGLIDLSNQTAIVHLDLDTTRFDEKLAAARLRAEKQLGLPGTGGSGGNNPPPPIPPSGSAPHGPNQDTHLGSILTSINSAVFKVNNSVDRLSSVLAAFKPTIPPPDAPHPEFLSGLKTFITSLDAHNTKFGVSVDKFATIIEEFKPGENQPGINTKQIESNAAVVAALNKLTLAVSKFTPPSPSSPRTSPEGTLKPAGHISSETDELLKETKAFVARRIANLQQILNSVKNLPDNTRLSSSEIGKVTKSSDFLMESGGSTKEALVTKINSKMKDLQKLEQEHVRQNELYKTQGAAPPIPPTPPSGKGTIGGSDGEFLGGLKAFITGLDTQLTRFTTDITKFGEIIAGFKATKAPEGKETTALTTAVGKLNAILAKFTPTTKDVVDADATAANAAYKRGIVGRKTVGRFDTLTDINEIKLKNPQALINTTIRDFALAMKESISRITRGIDSIKPGSNLQNYTPAQIAAAQQRDISPATRAEAARITRSAFFSKQRDLAIGGQHGEAIDVEKEKAQKIKENIRTFDADMKAESVAAKTRAKASADTFDEDIRADKQATKDKKANSNRLTSIGQQHAKVLESIHGQANADERELNKGFTKAHKEAITAASQQARATLINTGVPTSGGFAGANVAEQTAAFQTKIRQVLTALDTAVSTRQNRVAQQQTAVTPEERQSATNALGIARQNVAARSAQVAGLVTQASQQGLSVPRDLLDLSNKLIAATAERIRQETQLLRLLLAEDVAAKSGIGPVKQKAAVAQVATIRGELATQGVSEQSRQAALQTEQRLLQSVTQRTSAYVQQNGVIKEQQDGLDKFVSRFQQLARFAFAGGLIFGIIGVVKNSITQVVSLEAELVRIQGILGRTNINDSLKIEQNVLDQARRYGVNLGQIVNTVKDFAQAGFTLAQSLKLTEAVSKATVGGGLTTPQATQTAIAVENISGGRVSADAIFGRIAKVERTNAVTGEDLALIVQRVGALANQFQERQVGAADSFDTLIGLGTTIIENTRITGNQAATGLRFLLGRLTQPQTERKLQQQFGIKLASDADGKTLRPLPDILSDIATLFKLLKAQNRTGESTALLTTVAGTRQAYQAAALFDNFGKAMDTARESAFAFGDVERRTALQLETLQSKFGQLTAATIAYANVLLEKTGLIGALKFGADKAIGALKYAAESPGTAFLATLATYVGFKGISKVGAIGRGVAATGATDESLLYGASKVASASKVGTFFTRIGAAVGIGGSAEAAVAGAGKGFFLLRALGLVGGFVAKITGYGTLILLGFQLAQFVAKLAGFGKGLASATIDIPSYEDIATKFDFGKEFTTTTRGYGTSNLGFIKIINQIVDNANAAVLKNLSATKKGFNPAVITGGATDRRYRPAFEEAAVEQAKKLLPGFGEIPKEKQTEAILNYINSSVKFAGGPTEAAATSVQKAVEEQIGKLTDLFNDPTLLTNVQKRFSDVPATIQKLRPGGRGGPIYTTVAADKLEPAKVVIKQLEQDLPNAFSKLSLSIANVAKSFSFLDAINRELENGATNTGQALDKVFEEFFNPIGKSAGAQKVIQRNIRGLDVGIASSVGLGDVQSRLGQEVQGAVPSVVQDGLKFFTFLREEAIKVLEAQLAGIKNTNSPAAIALKERLRIIGLAENAGAATLRIPSTIAAQRIVRDRLVDLLSNFAKQREEAIGTKTAFNAAGLPFDSRRELQSNFEGLARGLAGVTAQIHGDLIRARLKVSGVRVAIGEDQGTSDTGDEGITPKMSETAREAQKIANRLVYGAISQQEKDSLDHQVSELEKAYSIITQNKKVLGKLEPEDQKFLTKYLSIDSDPKNKDAQRERAEGLADFLRIVTRGLGIITTENALFERGNILLRQRAALAQTIAETQAQAAQSELERAARRGDLVTEFGGYGARRQSIQLERDTARQRAQADFDLQKQELYNKADSEGNLGSELYKNSLLELQGRRDIAITAADLTAQNKLADQPANARLQLEEQITANVRAAVESASSGLLSVISSFESLTSGQLFQRILDPIANEITSGFAKNFRDALVGDQGLLQKQAEDLVGGPARMAGKTREARLEAQILDTSLILTARKMAAILSESTLGVTGAGPEAIPATTGPAAIAASGTGVAGNLPQGAGGTAALIAAGVPGFLLGGRAIGGPNAFLAGGRGNLTQGAGGSTLAGYSGNLPGSQFFGSISGGFKGATFKERLKNLKDAALPLIGAYGGAALGGEIGGKGTKGSYASEGGAIGSGVGSLIGGPAGGLVGGLIGGIFGGLFGKATPKPTPELSILEKIERGQRAQIQAIENQTRQLLTIDNRVLNAPASLAITGYRPFNAGAGTGAIIGSPQVYITVDARGTTQPNRIIDAVGAGVSKGLRNVGTYVPKY